MKTNKETAEQAAERKYTQGVYVINGIDICEASRECFVEGAKWQAEQLFKDDAIQTLEKSLALLLKKQERMYSEEDIKLAFEAGHKKGFSGYPNTENWKAPSFEDWFEKFKKK